MRSDPVCMQALSSPVSGLLAQHFDRTNIVACGCLIWVGIPSSSFLHVVKAAAVSCPL